MAVGQYIEIVMQGYAVARGSNQKNFFGVYGFRRTTQANPLVKANIEAAFQASIGAAILAAVSVDYTQTLTTVRWKDDATDPPVGFVEAGVGAIAGDRGPDFQAVTIQMKSGVRGKRFNGSKHLGPVAESDTTGDALTVGGAGRYNTVAAAIAAGFTDASGNVWQPCIYSTRPPANYTANPTTVVASIVVRCLLNKTLGTMRRRKVRTVN